MFGLLYTSEVVISGTVKGILNCEAIGLGRVDIVESDHDRGQLQGTRRLSMKQCVTRLNE